MSKTILITGASGYLANALLPCVAQRARVVGIARNTSAISADVAAVSVDITDRAAVFDAVLSQQPDAIIHCAAVNPGGTEQDMIGVNVVGTQNIAEAAKQLGCRLVSVSSDTVYDGLHAPYADQDAASPLKENPYAVTKSKGEAHIRAITPDAVIVRTSLIYGIDKIDRGTAGFATRLAAGETLKLFTDVIRQPVHDKALSQGLCALALDHTAVSGTLNLAGDEAMSRYEFGVRMLDHWRIHYTGQLEAVSGAGIPGLPLDVSVSMQKAEALGLPTPGVTKVLSGTGE